MSNDFFLLIIASKSEHSDVLSHVSGRGIMDLEFESDGELMIIIIIIIMMNNSTSL